jgi:hypothetical protein
MTNWKGFLLTAEEEAAIDRIIEAELGPRPVQPEPVSPSPAPAASRKPNRPNPEALYALEQRVLLFLAMREAKKRAEQPQSQYRAYWLKV